MSDDDDYIKLLVIAVLAVGSWFLFAPSELGNRMEQASLEAGIASMSEPNGKTQEFDDSQSTPSPEELLAAIDELPQAAQKYYRVGFDSGLDEFSFHGCVVDQLEQPVVDAVVRYEVTGYFLAAGPGSGATRTDPDGCFKIESRGGGLTIRAIDHSQTEEFVFQAMQGQQRQTLVSFYNHQPTSGSSKYILSDYTAESPFIFRAWRKQSKSGGVVSKGKLEFSPIPDGRLYTVDLGANRGSGNAVEGESKGHLQVRFFRADEAGVDYRKRENYWIKRDWWIEISGANGGVQEVGSNDPYMAVAPSSGYVPNARIEMTLDENYQSDVSHRRYYYSADNGAVFGVIEIEVIALARGNPIVRIRHRSNFEGDRNLILSEG